MRRRPKKKPPRALVAQLEQARVAILRAVALIDQPQPWSDVETAAGELDERLTQVRQALAVTLADDVLEDLLTAATQWVQHWQAGAELDVETMEPADLETYTTESRKRMEALIVALRRNGVGV